MKRVAVITIKEINSNYGNALQNYATKCILENLNFKVETLFFECSDIDYKKMFIKRRIQQACFYKLPGNRFWWQYHVLKLKKFYKFYKRHCPYKYISSTDEIKNKYDYFVVGSDQVWNPKWYGTNPLKKDMYLLTFARSEQKVCMVPSFGLSELPLEWKSFFKEQLKLFPRLSVREQSGAEIIKELTGRIAEVLIDPTLMLDQKEWCVVEKKPKYINFNESYALLYFLGDISEERRRYIDSVLKENGLKAYVLNDRNFVDLYTVDPCEFLYMISHAGIVLTDSFHACVFSFIYERPFQVFEREGGETGMFSRIENLLDMFCLERKYINSGLENDLFECDYNEGKQVLQAERKKALDFLKKSLYLK